MSKNLTIDEAAELIGTYPNTLRYWVTQKTGPKSFKLGRRRLFREDDVVAWIEAKYAEQQNAS